MLEYKTCFALVISTLVLSACGGGGGSTPLAPVVVPSEPVVIPPPVVVPPPTVSTVSPAKATVGAASTFVVTGANLVDGMKFALDQCDGIVELGGASSTERRFQCTPGGAFGVHQGAVYASGSATAPLLSLSVDFQSAPMFAVINGTSHAVLKPDGTLWMWSVGTQSQAPTKIGDGFIDVALAGSATLAVKKDGSLWTWGDNSGGILGDGTTMPHYEPRQIGTGFVKVVVKGENTTRGETAQALKQDGSLWAWGGLNSASDLYEPQNTPYRLGTGFVDLVRGSQGALYAIKADGSMWTWDSHYYGTAFAPTKAGEGYVAVAAGYDVTYGLKADGTLWNWGRNAPNRDPAVRDEATPVRIGEGFSSVSAGPYHALAVKTDGTLWAGGSSLQGQFGDGGPGGGVFRQIGKDVVGAWGGTMCSLIQKTDGTLWATGYCDFADGKYGRYSYTPIQIALP